ncbi:MAG: hypothetical protein FJ399_18910, partial [Verrucomicrobia bacterium]|nr:hypothetical protein [Verrucomicrobiota bacterium]
MNSCPAPDPAMRTNPAAPAFPLPRPSRSVLLVAAALLALHLSLAVLSLVRENATIDEVAHLPAGISYWQTGTFKLYHHNPPLVKLAAALPVVLANPEMEPLYQSAAWREEPSSHGNFAQLFAGLNAPRYFELFTLGRLVMPLFSLLGGIVVFAWSSRLFGPRGGLLSLALWCLCPNLLAHGRLVTTDAAATSLGVAATYLFWCYLQRPCLRRAGLAGLLLGVALLTKFSLLLLLGVWPLLWLGHELAQGDRAGRLARWGRGFRHASLVLGLAVLVINAGYLFEGTGRPLGSFDFASASLTRPGVTTRRSANPVLDVAWQHRVNRFRDTWLGSLPAPFPAHFLLGFDEQKIESEALPLVWFNPKADPAARTGYLVYLDGTLRRQGWRSYYLKALLYKLPEGTWGLLVLGLAVALVVRRARLSWSTELALAVVPLTVLLAMTVLTDINLGLRYVLPILPYLYISLGRLAPWAEGAATSVRAIAWSLIGLNGAAVALATFAIHPHYLAYFNRVSGGPARGSEHLIDSNLDWGQDLVGLQRWLERNARGESIGLACFGAINPNIFQTVAPPSSGASASTRAGSSAFHWFLPPVRPGTITPLPGPAAERAGPAPRLAPGLYAVSASLVRGLPGQFHDPAARSWLPAWRTSAH